MQVSVPDYEDDGKVAGADAESPAEATEHTRTQHLLLTLGREMGFDLWVARNDRGRRCDGCELGGLPGVLDQLPEQFNDATTRTIELIDVLWLRGNSIEAAFEVECTTSIYSGLLRMSDLPLALRLNLGIRHLTHCVPTERQEKVDWRGAATDLLPARHAAREGVWLYIGMEDLAEKVEGLRKIGVGEVAEGKFFGRPRDSFSARRQTTLS